VAVPGVFTTTGVFTNSSERPRVSLSAVEVGSMYAVACRAAVAALLLLSTACGDSGPVTPTPADQPPPAPQPAPAPPPPPRTNFPPLTGPSRTFVFERPLSYGVSHYTASSRFVLYDNGAFVLQYPSIGAEYRGAYTDTDGVLILDWERGSTGGATARLTGESLAVQYGEVMTHSDFEDAQYVLTQ
jgi:hypothetical protein